MKVAVITERLLELISEQTVEAAIFTTYTFEPDFFELEVIPLLLDQNTGYSQDERVKRLMVREKLREAELPIDVYYDLPMFRLSGDCSPEMEYLCHGVDMGNCAFHGKVNMILLKDRNTGIQSLLLGAGSNNLTRSGWWDNIECQHWEEIISGAVSRKFINIVKEDIAFLRRHRATPDQKSSAIDLIHQFILTCKGSNSAPPVHYYGLNSKQRYGSFIKFIQNIQIINFQQCDWKLEIVSPFFANDVENKEHEKFFGLGVKEIFLLLPFDEERNALCKDEYFENIRREKKIRWAEWEEEIGNTIGLNGENYRRLHAKLFNFTDGQQSWIFTGSINFTYKAIHDNVEAGFFVQLDNLGSLLKPISDDSQIDKFADLSEKIPGNSISQEQSELPELHLCFDWVSKQLVGRTARYRKYEIEILNAESKPVISPWEVRYIESKYGGENTNDLETLLKNGSLVKVRGRDLKKKSRPEILAHLVLLQQIGWSHKPLNLPNLTASQILAIYAGMPLERRQLMLIDAKIRALVLSVQGGELSLNVDNQKFVEFFCEYAEIFNAFNKLKRLLCQALEDGRLNQVDYFLTGTGVDSLPTLVNRTLEADSENEPLSYVTCYLILLSAKEIYGDRLFANRPNVIEERDKLLKQIRKIKSGNRLILENNSPYRRKKFFKWYEGEFFERYKVVEDSRESN